MRASSFVILSTGVKIPVPKSTLDTGFFNNFSPTFTRFSKFSFVATSMDESVPRSWYRSQQPYRRTDFEILKIRTQGYQDVLGGNFSNQICWPSMGT
ncbi:hypothetical protein NC653_032332 [Populus alba x Populus x berolinensis]|uniref:Uncharacterized protein n=1 Tax=Populus alba x Populus x berolinensis TaxID=444605 RepID=A0AAD6LU37_9ROSI|nr:hypothetical protein NC653_032332 [Populus alba x Populus x berolinensis]